jgi:acetyltransferase
VLGSSRLPKGERLAIVTNGGGPGVVAADSAAENGVPLAELSADTIARLDAKLPPQWSHGNPIDLIGDAGPERFAEATAAALADPGVDAVLAMYSPVAVTEPADAARAVGEAAKGSPKPVLAAWLGDINPSETRAYLESQGIPNFYTPENAVEAFSFLNLHRRNQVQLLQVPAALERTVEARAPDFPRVEAIRRRAVAEGRSLLTQAEAQDLLSAFGLPVPRSVLAPTRDAAVAAAREIGFPAVLKIHSPDITHKSDVGGVRLNLQNADMVASAFDDIVRHTARLRPEASIEGVLVQSMLRFAHAREVLIGIATDAVFGPVISFGAGGVAVEAVRDAALALPPLNAMLARDLMEGLEPLTKGIILVPVPLAPKRLTTRGYNQAERLAAALGALTGLPVADAALARKRETPTQTALTPEERRVNVSGAFAGGGVQGRRAVLVDDVLTTGATLGACAEALSAAGAVRVEAVTFARARAVGEF